MPDVQAIVDAQAEHERVERVRGAVVQGEREPPGDGGQLGDDVPGRIPRFVDDDFGQAPFAEDEAAVPEAGELGRDVGHVLGAEVGVVGELEGEPGEAESVVAVEAVEPAVVVEPQCGAVEMVGLQPVLRAVWVRCAEQASAQDGEPGEQHDEERLRQRGKLVAGRVRRPLASPARPRRQ
ncbi:hypothetical protein [Streptosporangium canum]|uniref:hypothetical protein n=1 Tax=Streptosporangium canum TaxID=324952 RepID=UPI001C430FF0|nr:hypothetical protein [Streptosporangium canum]